MSSMWTKLAIANICQTGCAIIPKVSKHGDRWNSLERCEFHIEQERRNKEWADTAPINEVVREIINGRVDIMDAKRVYTHFYEQYFEAGEMPYGVAKARDGDPYDWVLSQLIHDYSHLIEEEEHE